MNPPKRIVAFDMGNLSNRNFQYELRLISKARLQIRDHAIESARQTSNRILEKKIGANAYYYKIHIYPHHILRENPLATGAGADRMSMGMSKAFGKPIGVAAQVKAGQTLISLRLNKEDMELGKKALIRAAHKLPCSCSIQVVEHK